MKIYSQFIHHRYFVTLAKAFPEHEFLFNHLWKKDQTLALPTNIRIGLPEEADVFLENNPDEFIDKPKNYVRILHVMPRLWDSTQPVELIKKELSSVNTIAISKYVCDTWGGQCLYAPHVLFNDEWDAKYSGTYNKGLIHGNNMMSRRYCKGTDFLLKIMQQFEIDKFGVEPANNHVFNTDNFIGHLDMTIVFPRYRYYLWTAKFEGLSFAPIEAMAMGIPIITVRTPDWEDIIEHGKNGFLFDLGDYNSVAEYISVLSGDLQFAKSMGKAGKERILDYCNLENYRKQYSCIFNNCYK